MTIPPRLTVQRQRPVEDRPCKVCGLALPEHTGACCAICGDAVEHHDRARPNESAPILFAECLAGRVRTASARRNTGIPLTDVDEAALTLDPSYARSAA